MAFCCDTIHSKAQIMRKEGFMKALSDAGLRFQEKWMFSHAFTIHDGFRIMDQIHNMSEKPTAIFTGNDQVAAGIIKRARYYQYEVPKQLAVLGYDNQSICEVTDPEITTIDIPVEEPGSKSRMCNGKPSEWGKRLTEGCRDTVPCIKNKTICLVYILILNYFLFYSDKNFVKKW